MKLRLILWLWCMLLAPALAQVQLEMLNENLTTAEQRYIERALGYMLEYYQRHGLQPNQKVRIRLFSSFKDYRDFQRQQLADAPGTLSYTGYFHPEEREVVLWRSRRFPRILIHESQHALLRSAYPRPPKWLNEGLSELFEGINSEGAVEPQGPRLRKLRRYLTSDLGIQVTRVLTMSPREFDARSDRGLDSYTCSWALLYFLWAQPEGKTMVAEVVKGCMGRESGSSVVNRVYPGGLSGLQSDISTFYQELAATPDLKVSP